MKERERERELSQLSRARRTIQDRRAQQSRFQPPSDETARDVFFRTFVESSVFELGAGGMIVYSTITMVLEVDQVDVPLLINFSEAMITSFFLTEWITRLHAFGRDWLFSLENLLDTFIVWVPGIFTVWFLQPLFADSGSGFLKTMRIIRMLRLLRLVKVFRNLRMMQDLWMLVRGLLKSGSTLVSALVLIIFTLYVFGIAAVDLIGKADYSGTEEDVQEAQQRFFGLWYSMLTLIRFLRADDSQDIMDALMQQQPYIWIFLWTFTAWAYLVLSNLVTALICNEAFETSKADESDLAKQLMLQKEEEIENLKEMFAELDEDGSGQVTLTEFQNAFSIETIKNKLTLMGLNEAQLLQLFHLLDTDGEGELDLDEFMGGMQALSGLATAKDMVILTKGMERIEKQVKSLMESSFSGGPSKDMLENQMTQFRVGINDRFRRTEDLVKDFAGKLQRVANLARAAGSAERAAESLEGEAPKSDETVPLVEEAS